jgi:hypothetical protein
MRRLFALFMAELRAAWEEWDVEIRPLKRRVRLPAWGWRFVTGVVIFALFASDEKVGLVLNARADCTYPANTSIETTRITLYEYNRT